MMKGYDKQEAMAIALDVGGSLIDSLSRMVQKQNNPLIVEAKRFIAENYADSLLSLSAVAEHLGVSHSYLSKLFKNSLGVYFTDYLNSCRIGRAADLLENTDLSVNEIAGRSGFNSSQSFIRVFKQFRGKTPGQYRETFRPN